MTEQRKKVALSLVQPSGELTIGNYIGALRNFAKMQDDYTCFFAVADMHSITVTQVPAHLRRRSQEVLAWYVATGLDPDRSTLFVQSQVPAHAELAWVLSSVTSIGQLGRMTQFKDKARQHADNLNAALYSYPVLMAADILLYQADLVPVGEDQRQHLELTRDIAERFNSRYSPTFTVPEPLIEEGIGKIMSLKNPEIKMSKSDPDQNAYILLKDDSEAIRRKIKRAVTDSEANFAYRDEQAGLQNLITIYASFSDERPEVIVDRYQGVSYSVFKEELADLVIEKLTPIQTRFKEVMNDKNMLAQLAADGAQKAQRVAARTLSKVHRKVGFLQ